MGWVVETDLAAYADRVQPWLDRDPVWNSVPSTAVRVRRDGTVPAEDAWLAWYEVGGEVGGVALRTPPFALLLTRLPAEAVAALVAVVPPGLPGIVGPARTAADVVDVYAVRTGVVFRHYRGSTLFELTELAPPSAPAGAARLATEADVGVCARWFADFDADVAGRASEPHLEVARRMVAADRLLLWERDGEPVCMVGWSVTVAGVSRIAPVWTPPDHRRHGYATAATAEAARRLLDRGRVALFADRANPTSTGIYLRLGFRPLGDWDEYRPDHHVT